MFISTGHWLCRFRLELKYLIVSEDERHGIKTDFNSLEKYLDARVDFFHENFNDEFELICPEDAAYERFDLMRILKEDYMT